MNNQVPDAELVEYKLKVLVNTIRFTALPVRKHAEMAEGPLFNILTEASMGVQSVDVQSVAYSTCKAICRMEVFFNFST